MKNILNLPIYEEEYPHSPSPAKMKFLGEFYDDVVEGKKVADDYYKIADLWYIEEWTEGAFNSTTGEYNGEKADVDNDVVASVAYNISEASTLCEASIGLVGHELYYSKEHSVVVVRLVDHWQELAEFYEENETPTEIDFSGRDPRYG